jgi:predicted RNA binding protein YcfA (HicA-like mRNA interferase family)
MARRITAGILAGGVGQKHPKPCLESATIKVRAIIRLIESDGWRQIRQTGSHRHFRHPAKPGTVTVAGHPRDDLHPKTQASIMRQAELTP